MSTSPLSDLALADVSDKLTSHGSSLQGDNREAIYALLQALERGLYGTLDHGYYLSAIDPGIGKTLSTSSFLRVWKEQGFHPSSSVLIGLSRLEEIDSYLRNSGLTRDDVAVLTSDRGRNALGVPHDQHGNARVMFTTQQMIEKRTRGRSFAEASEFYYDGKPRTLRIWDESFIPAEPLTPRVDDLARLPAAFRRQRPDYAAEAQQLAVALWAAKDGERAIVSGALAEPPSSALKKAKDQSLANVIEDLGRLAGREAVVVDMGEGDLRLAGSSLPIPEDFAPVIILDASGRVRSTYSVWEASGAPLHRLPSAVKDYSKLRVRLWERGAGKTTLLEPSVRGEIAEAVAEAIRGDMNSSWLIISYKDRPIEDLIRKALNGAEPSGGINFLTWGMHHGTNAYAHCKNVVLIGQMTYGKVGYRALADVLGAEHEDGERLLRTGEYQHHWLQALTRASVRESRGGLAGACNAYVIAPPGINAREVLAATFPRCSMETWSPECAQATGQAGDLIAILERAKAAGELPIAKGDLTAELGIQKTNLSRLLERAPVQDYLDRNHLRIERTQIRPASPFGAYEGDEYDKDGFSVEDWEDT